MSWSLFDMILKITNEQKWRSKSNENDDLLANDNGD